MKRSLNVLGKGHENMYNIEKKITEIPNLFSNPQPPY